LFVIGYKKVAELQKQSRLCIFEQGDRKLPFSEQFCHLKRKLDLRKAKLSTLLQLVLKAFQLLLQNVLLTAIAWIILHLNKNIISILKVGFFDVIFLESSDNIFIWKQLLKESGFFICLVLCFY
jgi:hypothetical protein